MTGSEFKQHRLNRCITQRALGEMLGYKGKSAENTVQNWEYDKQPIPLKHFRKLSEILLVPLEKFIP